MAKNLTYHDIIFRGSKLRVYGTYYAGKYGTMEEPPEPDQFEIELVEIGNIDIQFNVTELCEEFIDEIEEDILNLHYR